VSSATAADEESTSNPFQPTLPAPPPPSLKDARQRIVQDCFVRPCHGTWPVQRRFEGEPGLAGSSSASLRRLGLNSFSASLCLPCVWSPHRCDGPVLPGRSAAGQWPRCPSRISSTRARRTTSPSSESSLLSRVPPASGFRAGGSTPPPPFLLRLHGPFIAPGRTRPHTLTLARTPTGRASAVMPSSTRPVLTRCVPWTAALARGDRVWGQGGDIASRRHRRPSRPTDRPPAGRQRLTIFCSASFAPGCRFHPGGALHLWPRGHAPLRGASCQVASMPRPDRSSSSAEVQQTARVHNLSGDRGQSQPLTFR